MQLLKLRLTVILLAFFATAVGGFSQQSNSDNDKKQSKSEKDKSADKDKNKDKDKDTKEKNNQSVFAGSYDTKSAKKTTDTATLGFKGVDGNGYVDPDKLKEDPNGDDLRVAQLMTGVKTNPEEAKAFVDNGKLKSR
jgi:hypothetical protein